MRVLRLSPVVLVAVALGLAGVACSTAGSPGVDPTPTVRVPEAEFLASHIAQVRDIDDAVGARAALETFMRYYGSEATGRDCIQILEIVEWHVLEPDVDHRDVWRVRIRPAQQNNWWEYELSTETGGVSGIRHWLMDCPHGTLRGRMTDA